MQERTCRGLEITCEREKDTKREEGERDKEGVREDERKTERTKRMGEGTTKT